MKTGLERIEKKKDLTTQVAEFMEKKERLLKERGKSLPKVERRKRKKRRKR